MKLFYTTILLATIAFSGSVNINIDENPNKEYYPDIESKYVDAYISDTYELKEKFTKLRVIPRENGVLNAEVNNWAYCNGKIITENGRILAKSYGSSLMSANVKSNKTYYITVTKKNPKFCKWVEIIIPGR